MDAIPHRIGGEPADVPPRRGTPEYDALQAKRAQEMKPLLSAAFLSIPALRNTSDRSLVEMAKTMDLNAIAKKTGRTPESILKMALRLGIARTAPGH